MFLDVPTHVSKINPSVYFNKSYLNLSILFFVSYLSVTSSKSKIKEF